MATTNDITGDSIQTKTNTDQYRDGWDRIFGKKKKPETNEVPAVDIGLVVPGQQNSQGQTIFAEKNDDAKS